LVALPFFSFSPSDRGLDGAFISLLVALVLQMLLKIRIDFLEAFKISPDSANSHEDDQNNGSSHHGEPDDKYMAAPGTACSQSPHGISAAWARVWIFGIASYDHADTALS
jgi:hypothetical protein